MRIGTCPSPSKNHKYPNPTRNRLASNPPAQSKTMAQTAQCNDNAASRNLSDKLCSPYVRSVVILAVGKDGRKGSKEALVVDSTKGGFGRQFPAKSAMQEPVGSGYTAERRSSRLTWPRRTPHSNVGRFRHFVAKALISTDRQASSPLRWHPCTTVAGVLCRSTSAPCRRGLRTLASQLCLS